MNPTKTRDVIHLLFEAKPIEKRNEWITFLESEEFESVDDLKSISEDVWNSLKLPLAIKEKLKSYVKEQTQSNEKKEPLPVVDTRPLTQIDCIVFDISSSMNSKSVDPLNSRLGASKILFHTMVDKLIGHELPHALGTKLYDAILEAANKILEFKNNFKSLLAEECKYRIFCLTDGDDNAVSDHDCKLRESSTPYWKVSQFCQENNIVLDSVPVASENIPLKKMTIGTGGLSLRILDMQQGASLFEREAIIKVAAREKATINCSETIPIITSESSLDCFSLTKAVEDVKSTVPKAMTQSKTLTQEDISKIIQNNKSKNNTNNTNNNNNNATTTTTTTTSYGGPSVKRILKEYSQFHDETIGVHAYITEDDVHFWKLILTGPKDTPYEGGLFSCYLKFPTDYPFKAPDFRFCTGVFHPNVNNDGKVCMPILKDKWSPAITSFKVMQEVIELLKYPNAQDALDVVKANLYNDDRDLFNKMAKQYTADKASKNLEELKSELNIKYLQ